MAGALDPDDGGQQLLLGKMLLERGLITPDQLREALVERARSVSDGDRQATPLGGILVRKGYLSDSQLLGLMAEQNGGPAFEAPPGAAPYNAPPVHSGPQLPVVSTPDPLMEGGHLGKYQLLRELGRGGMGVVYEALDSQLNRKVALKLMLTNPNADPKERALEEERFVQEAQLSAKLKHVHIVTVYEAGLLEGRQFLSMEMIEGQAFNEWRKTVTLRDQIKVVADVAAAVHHAHEQGILHRDLKPRNILVTAAGHAYVTDFGLAKSLGKNVHHSLTGSGAVVGTPAYMSPEQAQGLDRVDWRTDIYSLGVILYECMTGKTPFTGESPIEILMKVVKDPVVPPLQVVDAGVALGLDKGIENICLKALAKKDRDRYVTAQAFADDLFKWLSGEKVHVVVPKVAGKANKRIYVLTALLFLALMAGLAFLAMNSARQSIRVELDLAKKAMTDENYSEASVQYRLALAKDPSSAEATAGVAAALEGIERKKKESEDKIRAGVIEKFRQAEEATIRAKKIADAERDARSDEERAKLAEERIKADLAAKKAAEDAAKAEADFRKTQTLVVASPGTGEDAWKGAINLLPMVDPKRNAVLGTWTLGDRGALSSDRTPFARVEIPFQLPQEYDFRAVIERRTGSGAVSVILSKGGTQFRCEVGGEGNTRIAFESSKPPKGLEFPATQSDPMCLRNDRTYTLLLQVRNEGAKAFLDGKQVLSWSTQFADVGLNPLWRLRNTLRLGIGSHESETVFHRMELLEITGKGRKPEIGPPPVLKASAGVPSPLKPMLIGEYYLGTNFQSLSLRRLDPSIDFRWNEGPGWPGGPVDSFSCRWTGFLHVPRTAKYTFSATADDGVRMFIDDTQVLAGWSGRTEAPRIAEIILDEGYHRFRLEHYEQAYLATMVLSWTSTPGQPPLPITPKSFFHSPSEMQTYVAPRAPELVGIIAGHGQNITSVAFDPAGALLAVAGEDRKVRLFDATTRKDLGVTANHPSGVVCVVFSPDGKTFATGARDNKVRVWDTQNRTELKTLEGPTAFVQTLAFSPDGKRLAAGSNDRSVRIWDFDSEGDPQLLTGHTAGVESAAFSRDGKRLATTGRDHMLRFWDLAAGKELRVVEAHADFAESVVYSPGGRTIATAGWDGLIKLWDPETGAELKTIGAGRSAEVSCLAFSPDGLLLAAGCNDGMIRVWDPVEGKQVKMLAGHMAQVSSLAFAPTGRILVSGSADTSVRFWNLDK